MSSRKIGVNLDCRDGHVGLNDAPLPAAAVLACFATFELRVVNKCARGAAAQRQEVVNQRRPCLPLSVCGKTCRKKHKGVSDPLAAAQTVTGAVARCRKCTSSPVAGVQGICGCLAKRQGDERERGQRAGF